MLLVIGLVFLWLRPRHVKRLWPLVIPGLVMVHRGPWSPRHVPRALLPAEGIVAQQSDAAVGSGRIASLGPALDEAAKTPLLGQGYGTRIVEGPNANAFIVDNGWLSTLLETGALGTLAWLLVFVGFVRRLARRARQADGDVAWLACSLAASIAAFAVGMFVYDAFSFIQVTLLIFILLALGVAIFAADDHSDSRVSRIGCPTLRGCEPGRDAGAAAHADRSPTRGSGHEDRVGWQPRGSAEHGERSRLAAHALYRARTTYDGR